MELGEHLEMRFCAANGCLRSSAVFEQHLPADEGWAWIALIDRVDRWWRVVGDVFAFGWALTVSAEVVGDPEVGG